MTLDDRLNTLSQWLDNTAAGSTPDPGDLDRRHHRRRRTRQVASSAVVIAVLAVGVLTIVTLADGSSSQVAAGSAADDTTGSADPAEATETGSLPAFVLADPSTDWELITPPRAETSPSLALAGEQFVQVYVRFTTDQDPFSNHQGALDGTIRVAVGTYDESLPDLFTGQSTDVTIAGRGFEIVETDRPGFRQLALVPIDLSERTYVVTGRGIDAETLIAMAELIDPTAPVPRIGPAPDGFVVIYSGLPEFAALSIGASVTYQRPGGDGTLTITTFDGVAISCFAHSWAYDNTEIAPIGGDSGVIAQIAGQPGGTGSYRALWNRDSDTLIHIVADGIDRNELLRLADQLQLSTDPTTATTTSLELVF